MRLDAIDQLKGEAATSMIGHLERIKADALAKRASESAASLDSSIENPEPENKTPQPAPEFEIQFLTIDGKSSFQKSLASIESPKARRAINSLVDRIGSGLSEGSKPVIGADSDIHIRVAFAHLNGGPRVYFVRRGKTIVFLTCGLEADTVSDSIFALRHGHSVIKSLEAKGV